MEHLLTDEALLEVAIIIVAILFITYQVYNHYANLKVIDFFLTEYYKEKGIELISSSTLKIADKLKYGVPLIPFISLYTSTFKIFSSLDEKYYLVLETSEANGKEHIRYVEICLTTQMSITINEFDTYEF